MSNEQHISYLPLADPADLQTLNLFSGYLNVFNSSYFYILSSHPKTSNPKPLLVWFNGGPGCSSLDGFFLENGPLRYSPTSITLNSGYWSDYDILYVDNPPGTGYSTGDAYTKTAQVIDGFKEFYRLFKEIYSYEDLYLGGESFAGVWVPLMARVMNVKGVILGNPWIDPLNQYPSILEYSQKYGLLSGKFLDQAQEDTRACLELMKGKVLVNYIKCEEIINHVLEESQTTGFCINKYDYRLRDTAPNQQCGMFWPDGVSEMKVYLGRKDVKKALHSSYEPELWQECNYRVYGNIINDDSVEPSVNIFKELLERMKIVIFAGDKDIICNYIGLRKSMQAKFGDAPTQSWKYGDMQQWGNLSFFVVKNASHMVPFDHPMAAREVSKTMLVVSSNGGASTPIPTLLPDTSFAQSKTISAPSHFFAGLLLLIFFVFAIFGGLFVRRKIATVQEWNSVPEEEDVAIEMITRGEVVLSDSDYDQLIKD